MFKKRSKGVKFKEIVVHEPLFEKFNFNKASPLVYLDVGGQHYTTTIDTLTKIETSMLYIMFSGKYSLHPDPQTGYIFIDRDGCLFKYVLSFLRSGRWDIPNDIGMIQKMMIESDYYGLPFYWQIDFKLHQKGIFSFLRRNRLYLNDIQIISRHKPKNQKRLRKILGMDKLNDFSEKGPRASLRIDLLNFCIHPTHYSIRHNASKSYGALRGWIFLGENYKTETWEVIKRHEKDQSISNKTRSVASWKLNCNNKFYGRFMIKSLPDYGAINLSNIEIYGYVKPMNVQIN